MDLRRILEQQQERKDDGEKDVIKEIETKENTKDYEKTMKSCKNVKGWVT